MKYLKKTLFVLGVVSACIGSYSPLPLLFLWILSDIR